MSKRIKEQKHKSIEKLFAWLKLSPGQEKVMRPALEQMTVFEIVKPMIIADLISGNCSREGIAGAYGVSSNKVRTVGIAIGVYQPRQRSRLKDGTQNISK